jgi:hypothetical protein
MQPYTKQHGIGDLQFTFFTEEAVAWYDPLKPYTFIEYQWVIDNVPLEGQVVVDAGAHHGNYAIVFKGAYAIYAFEMNPDFALYAQENLKLNDVGNYSVFPQRLTEFNTVGKFMGQKPDIYKMDIESDEFHVLPVELRENPQVHTWIVEVHPWGGDPNDIARLFSGYNLLKVDREAMKVRPYRIGETWKSHATLIATK